MGYWDSEGIRQCHERLSESGKRLQVLADTCVEETAIGYMAAQDRAVLAGTCEKLRQTAAFVNALTEMVLHIQKLYDENEEKIADYFDLAIVKAPHTELGVSTFEGLAGHEAQMPFDRG